MSRKSTNEPTVLTFDIGNTLTGIGVFRGEHLEESFTLSSRLPRTGDELRPVLGTLLEPYLDRLCSSGAAVIGSVVPSLTDAYTELCRALLGSEPLVVRAEEARGILVDVADPAGVGADRVANSIAAGVLYRTPAIVVDLGTATNFDVVLDGPRYVGGIIAPGIASSAEELFRRGARLSKVEIRRPERAVGANTTDCLQSGVYFGAVAQIDGLVKRIRDELGVKPIVIGTGGLADQIAEDSKAIRVVDQELTLKGLRLLAVAQRSFRRKRR